MKKVEAFRTEGYSETPHPSPPEGFQQNLSDFQQNLSGLVGNTVGELSEDAKNVGSALYGFPIGSALKLIGLATILYIGFKVAGKFVNIKEKLTHL